MEEKIPIPESNITWSLKNKTLTISGTGAMPDYGSCGASWNGGSHLIETVIIEEGVTTIGYSAFRQCCLTSVCIPNSVITIESEAFYYCERLTSICIPNSVTTIGAEAFSGCRSLTKFIVKVGNVSYKAMDGVLFAVNQDTLTLIKYPPAKSATPYSIPNAVTTIVKGAFSGCTGLKGIHIPNSVTTIGDYAFQKCTGLKSIRIPNSVTTIGDFVFFVCSNLTRIYIPNSIVAIGYRAFDSCKSLRSISIRATVPPSLDECAFTFRLNTSTILIKVPHQSVEAYRTVKGWSRFKRIVGSDG